VHSAVGNSATCHDDAAPICGHLPAIAIHAPNTAATASPTTDPVAPVTRHPKQSGTMAMIVTTSFDRHRRSSSGQ
jgi:hypothetical protein